MSILISRKGGGSGGGGGAPSGPAGGILGGTYPNPTFATNMYGTSLPGSPVNAQEYTLVDSTTNPAYQWRFRYNSGSSSSYKWEFVGGAPWTTANESSTTVSSVTFADFGTLLQLAVPVEGDYLCGTSAGFISHNQGGPITCYVSVYAGAAGEVYAGNLTIAASAAQAATRFHRLNGISAGTNVRMRGGSGSGTMTVNNREVSLLPIRVA